MSSGNGLDSNPGHSSWPFWTVAASITVIVLGANAPLPLLTLYQSEWGLSTAVLTIVYACYTAGVLAAVFILGPASDLIGRKRVLVPALVTMALGLITCLVAPNVWVLMAARVLQGFAVGAGVTTSVAALGELHPDPHDHGKNALTATVATVGGLAGGPLVAGSLAEFAPYPTLTPYVICLVLIGVLVAGMLRVPETIARRRPFRLQSVVVKIPPEDATSFYLATFVELTAFAVAGTFAGLGASFSRDLLGIQSHFAAGLIVALLFLCSATSQLLFNRWPVKRTMAVGLLVLIAGLITFSAAVVLHAGVPFFASAAILGCGHGLAYLGSQELTDRIAPRDRRAQVFSAFQLGLYVGATVPALAVGFAAKGFGFEPATLAFVATIIGFCLIALIWIQTSTAPALRVEQRASNPAA